MSNAIAAIPPEEVTSFDILCGRDKQTYNHIANRRFRFVTAVNVERYKNLTTRRDKSMMVQSVYSQIIKAGGRFLVKRPHDQYYIPVSEVVAREKISHSLRDKFPTVAKQLRNYVRTKLRQDLVSKRYEDDFYHEITAKLLDFEFPKSIQGCVDERDKQLDKLLTEVLETSCSTKNSQQVQLQKSSISSKVPVEMTTSSGQFALSLQEQETTTVPPLLHGAPSPISTSQEHADPTIAALNSSRTLQHGIWQATTPTVSPPSQEPSSNVAYHGVPLQQHPSTTTAVITTLNAPRSTCCSGALFQSLEDFANRNLHLVDLDDAWFANNTTVDTQDCSLQPYSWNNTRGDDALVKACNDIQEMYDESILPTTFDERDCDDVVRMHRFASSS